MSANANHNSSGTACVDTPVFGFVDLIIGGLSAAGIAASDEHEGWYAVSGVFLLSGTVGSIYAFKCQEENAPKEDPDNAPPASNTAPSWEADVDPEAKEATRDDWGSGPTDNPPPTPPPTSQHPLLKLRIDPNSPIVKTPPAPEKISCRDKPNACPPSQHCAIAGDEAGFCVPN
jgi:hypothetical protein